MQETQETWVQSLGWEVPLEEGWQPTPVFWPGEPHGQRTWWATVHRPTKSQTWLKGFSMHSPPNSPPIQAATQHWGELPWKLWNVRKVAADLVLWVSSDMPSTYSFRWHCSTRELFVWKGELGQCSEAPVFYCTTLSYSQHSDCSSVWIKELWGADSPRKSCIP